MSTVKSSNRVTKAQLAERDAQIEALRTEVAQRQEEIGARVAYEQALETNLADQAVYIAETSVRLGEWEARYSEDLALCAAIEDELGKVIEDLFSRLRFAVTTLATVATYGGDDPAIVQGIVRPALLDLGPFVVNGTQEDAFVNANARLNATLFVVTEDAEEQGMDQAAENDIFFETWTVTE